MNPHWEWAVSVMSQRHVWWNLGVRVWGVFVLWGYHGCVKRTKPSSCCVDSPTSNFTVGLDVGHEVLSSPRVQTSIWKEYWFILTVRMVVSLSEWNLALKSPEKPFTNIVRHMAHNHITALMCTHIHKHLSHLPTWHTHKSDENRPRCQGKSHISWGTVRVRVCVFMCVLFPRIHISLGDMMSMWQEQGITELSHSPQGASVMIKRTFGRATEALPKHPSSHLLYHSLTWPHKFNTRVPVDPYWWQTSRSKSYHRLLFWWG